MLNYTPLPQVKIKKQSPVKHWQFGVLAFFLLATTLSILAYAGYNYEENKRLATQARAIANAPIPTITPTPTPEIIRIPGNNPYEVLRNALSQKNYKMSVYGSLPLSYPLSPEEASHAALLLLPKSADYRNATSFYSIANRIVRIQYTTDANDRTFIVSDASQSAFIISDKEKVVTAIPFTSPYWATVSKYMSFANPLWILSGNWTQSSTNTWKTQKNGITVVVTSNASTNLPEQIFFDESGDTITIDMQQIDDMTATDIPSRYAIIPAGATPTPTR